MTAAHTQNTTTDDAGTAASGGPSTSGVPGGPSNPHTAGQGLNKAATVDLLGRYSNRTSWTKELVDLPKASLGDRKGAERPRRTKITRLSARQVSDLVSGYQAGETVYELAARFAIHRATVSAHLHREGITMRRQGLDNDSVNHAVILYEQGWSVARIGARLGVDATTAWSALRARGIPMRDAQGRDR
jgi:lambda repressor-like predicted transcriptional regulator